MGDWDGWVEANEPATELHCGRKVVETIEAGLFVLICGKCGRYWQTGIKPTSSPTGVSVRRMIAATSKHYGAKAA